MTDEARRLQRIEAAVRAAWAIDMIWNEIPHGDQWPPELTELREALAAEHGGEEIDPEVEAACAAYLLAWPQMTEEAKRERRGRMRLALDAARKVRP